jgi:DNA-3-methyladenine glycosylase II
MQTPTSTPAPIRTDGDSTGQATRAGAIRCARPFDLGLSLSFLCGFGPTAGEQVIDESGLTKALMIQGRPIGVRLAADGPNRLAYILTADGTIDRATEARALRRVTAFLSADEDLAPFYALTEGDPVMAPIARRLRGLHHVKFPSPFEAACWAVINQRIGMTHARAMKEALVQSTGDAITIGGRRHWAFPEPATVAACGEARLASILGSERKAKAVHAVGRAFAGVGETFFDDAPHQTIRAWLEGIHGVGPFTTGFVLFRGLGRFDRLPMMPQFTRAVAKVYGRPLGERDVLQLAAPYGAWAGHWALYLRASAFVSPDIPEVPAPVS